MSFNNEYKYKFSIVMAIYNVEKYLEEAILSVINQDIGFEESVQLILVNDGSPDNSKIICEKYKKLYPENIVYIEKENGGVSSARNLGIEYVEGKYVGFLDSDDKYSSRTLNNVYNFFEENHKYIDIVAIPIYFFEGKEGEHLLNYKFSKTRIINLMEQYRDIQLSAASSFIKKDILKMYKFNTKLFMAEDADLIAKILLRKCMYGVINEAEYWYRYRKEGNSTIQTTNYKKEAYTECLNLFSSQILEYAINIKGFIPEFIQYIVAYELRWRLKVTYIKNVLNNDELAEFKHKLTGILKFIDDKIIKEQKMLSLDHKIFLLKLKHGSNFKLDKICEKNNISYYLKNDEIFNLKNSIIQLQILEIKDGKVYLEGYVDTPLDGSDYSVVITNNDNEINSKLIKRSEKDVYSIGEIIKTRPGFNVSVPLENNQQNILKIKMKIGNYIISPKVKFDKYVRLYNNIDKSYFEENGYCVVSVYNQFVIFKSTSKVKYGRELRFLEEMIKNKAFKLAFLRLIIYIYKMLNKKKIWVFMDRTYKADDNAEHLLRYSNSMKDNIKKYYIISNECSDYNRLEKEFNLVSYGSVKHKILLLLADKVISSHAADFARNQFFGKALWLRNLQTFKFIFLQHGIIHNDVSVALNKYNRNISLFITSAYKEYKEVCSEKYYYDDKIVKLTGLPRYDSLRDDKKKQILIMPTWRTYLTITKDYASKEKVYNQEFIHSDYYKNYNNMINDERLLKVLKKYDYKIVFFIHPELQHQVDDFKKNKYVIFEDFSKSYQEIFKTSSLMVTDYSSVAFDFAYLKKPVIYYQFDREKFFSNHYKPGYFDYKKDGFGEVIENYDEVIKLLIEYIENRCEIKDQYKNRIEEFYAYTDRNNCKRVYDEIIKLK